MPPLGPGMAPRMAIMFMLSIHLNDIQVLDGDLLIAHLTSADLAREDPGLMGRWHPWNQRDDGQGRRRGSCRAVCAIALDNALVALTLADAGHIDLVASSEDISLDHIADIHVSSVVQAELLQVALCLNAGLLQVASLRLVTACAP